MKSALFLFSLFLSGSTFAATADTVHVTYNYVLRTVVTNDSTKPYDHQLLRMIGGITLTQDKIEINNTWYPRKPEMLVYEDGRLMSVTNENRTFFIYQKEMQQDRNAGSRPLQSGIAPSATAHPQGR